MCDYLDPDIIIMTETKIDSSVKYSEFPPPGYQGDIRKDRSQGGGGVMIAMKDTLCATSAEVPDTEEDMIWAKIETSEGNSAFVTAFVTPIFKKGSTCLPENYRPVSLTCVACKLLEHVICSHIRDHLGRQGILSTFQHGFRAMYSCETQLAVTIHDILNIRNRGIQSDIAILDFSKAFDKVPHKRLLGKLRLYGINDDIMAWIESFLWGRTQRVIIDGQFSSNSEVTSGVPQGTVLGPLLFLMYINDLPSVLQPSTKCRLFADDCLVYREIRSPEDQVSLQKYLDALEQWSIHCPLGYAI